MREAPQTRLAVLERRLIAALPGAAVVVVAFSVLVVGRPRPVVAARLRGGPTEGARWLSFRLELVQRFGDTERPLGGSAAVDVRLGTGETLAWKGGLDAEGAAEVRLEPRAKVTGPVRVRVTTDASREPALDASVSLGAQSWSRGARRSGGWVQSRNATGITLRARAERGAFAVPFQDALVVDAEELGRPVAGLALEAVADGAECTRSALTDSRGRARFVLRLREHGADVVLHAHPPGGEAVELPVELPVVPGALFARLVGCPGACRLEVTSPIVRSRAYVAIVSGTERLAGGAVDLAPDGAGGARGVLPLPALPRDTPLWAVVSSEPDLGSPSRVGWPISTSGDDEPRDTFDVADALLADGVGAALARDLARVRRVRALAAASAALSLVLTAVLVARRARAARRVLESHLEHEGADQETTSKVAGSGDGSPVLVVAAVLSLLFAAGLLFVFATWR